MSRAQSSHSQQLQSSHLIRVMTSMTTHCTYLHSPHPSRVQCNGSSFHLAPDGRWDAVWLLSRSQVSSQQDDEERVEHLWSKSNSLDGFHFCNTAHPGSNNASAGTPGRRNWAIGGLLPLAGLMCSLLQCEAVISTNTDRQGHTKWGPGPVCTRVCRVPACSVSTCPVPGLIGWHKFVSPHINQNCALTSLVYSTAQFYKVLFSWWHCQNYHRSNITHYCEDCV